jgi:chromosome segregation ATPase
MTLLSDFRQNFDRIVTAIEGVRTTIEKLTASKAEDTGKLRESEAARIAAEEKAEKLAQELAIVSAKLVDALAENAADDSELALVREAADRHKATAETATQELATLKADYEKYKGEAEAKDAEQELERANVLKNLETVWQSLESLNNQPDE